MLRQAAADDIDLLMKWRMEVLHHVFNIPTDDDLRDLYEANLEYYKTAIPSGEHIAVFAGKCHRLIIRAGNVRI